MSERILVEVASRKESGTAEARRMRHAGMVPGVIYGAGEDNVNIEMDHNKILHSLNNESFHSTILDVAVDGEKERAILREVQMHPASSVRVMHVDFMRVSKKDKLTMSVPLHFMGGEECPGVLVEEGIVTYAVVELDVTCLPADLPEYVEVDLSEMNVGDTVTYGDLKLPEGVESALMVSGGDPAMLVAMVSIQQLVEEEEIVDEDAAAEGEEGEEGEAEDGAEASDESADGAEE